MIREIINKAITRRRTTPYKVGKAVGIPTAVLYSFLKGENCLSLKRAEVVMEYLGIEVEVETNNEQSK